MGVAGGGDGVTGCGRWGRRSDATRRLEGAEFTWMASNSGMTNWYFCSSYARIVTRDTTPRVTHTVSPPCTGACDHIAVKIHGS